MTELGAALALDLDEVPVEASAEYLIAGVFSFGRGLFARGPIRGASTTYRKLTRLHRGQLVLSRLKAFEGAVAVVPDSFDGWFLSPEFPTFSWTVGSVDQEYLAFLCRWPDFWSMLARASKGIGARRERVHAADLLALDLRLPDVRDQRRVVIDLRLYSSASDRIGGLVEHATSLHTALIVSLATRPFLSDSAKLAAGWRREKLGAVMQPASASHRVDPATEYPNVGIFSFGRGIFEKPPIVGATTSATMLNRIAAGQFIYSRLFAFEGAYAYVPREFHGFYVSNEFPAFDPDPDRLDAYWLATVLRSPEIWAELGTRSKGLGVRRQRVPAEAVLDYEVWLPPITEQRSMVAAIDELEEASLRRKEMMGRVDALLPAALNDAFAGLS